MPAEDGAQEMNGLLSWALALNIPHKHKVVLMQMSVDAAYNHEIGRWTTTVESCNYRDVHGIAPGDLRNVLTDLCASKAAEFDRIDERKVAHYSLRPSSNRPVISRKNNVELKSENIVWGCKTAKGFTEFSNFELLAVLRDFEDVRKNMKFPLNQAQATALGNKLKELAKTPEDAIKIVTQSVAHSWRGFFPIRD